MTDRPVVLGLGGFGLNVRRLMYQTLIWPGVLGHDARGLGSPFDTQDVESAANALVDRMRRYVEFGRDLFGRKVLIDETQAIQLAPAQPSDPLCNGIAVIRKVRRPCYGVGHRATSKR